MRSCGTPTTTTCGDVRVGQEEGLDLGREHVEAADVDDLLRPPRDAEVAVLVDAAEVAGAKPLAVEGLGGLLGPLEVSGRHVRAAHLDLAGRAVGLAVAADPKLVARQGPADGGVPHLRRVVDVAGAGARRSRSSRTRSGSPGRRRRGARAPTAGRARPRRARCGPRRAPRERTPACGRTAPASRAARWRRDPRSPGPAGRARSSARRGRRSRRRRRAASSTPRPKACEIGTISAETSSELELEALRERDPAGARAPARDERALRRPGGAGGVEDRRGARAPVGSAASVPRPPTSSRVAPRSSTSSRPRTEGSSAAGRAPARRTRSPGARRPRRSPTAWRRRAPGAARTRAGGRPAAPPRPEAPGGEQGDDERGHVRGHQRHPVGGPGEPAEPLRQPVDGGARARRRSSAGPPGSGPGAKDPARRSCAAASRRLRHPAGARARC